MHINLIGFDRNLIIHISMLSPLPLGNSPKSHNFSTMKKFFVEKTFDRYLLSRFSSFFLPDTATWAVSSQGMQNHFGVLTGWLAASRLSGL